MKIIFKKNRNNFLIKKDGEIIIHLTVGEPEDATFNRDLSGISRIHKFISDICDKVKTGEIIEFEDQEYIENDD